MMCSLVASSRLAHGRLLFIDESGAKTNLTRLYGRAPRGVRVHDYVPPARPLGNHHDDRRRRT